jgi:hypothetical protein
MPAKHEPKKIRANCVSGPLDGGLKGRLQARLPAPQDCRLHAINGQSREAGFQPDSSMRDEFLGLRCSLPEVRCRRKLPRLRSRCMWLKAYRAGLADSMTYGPEHERVHSDVTDPDRCRVRPVTSLWEHASAQCRRFFVLVATETFQTVPFSSSATEVAAVQAAWGCLSTRAPLVPAASHRL